MKPTERKKGVGGEGEGLVFGEPSLRYASSFDTFLKRFTSPRIRTALSWKNQFATISKGKGLGETMPRTRLPPRFFFLLFLIEGRGYFPYRISLQHPEFQARKTCTGNLKIISIGQQQRGDRLKRRIFPPSILFRIHPELFLFSFFLFPFLFPLGKILSIDGRSFARRAFEKSKRSNLGSRETRRSNFRFSVETESNSAPILSLPDPRSFSSLSVLSIACFLSPRNANLVILQIFAIESSFGNRAWFIFPRGRFLFKGSAKGKFERRSMNRRRKTTRSREVKGRERGKGRVGGGFHWRARRLAQIAPCPKPVITINHRFCAQRRRAASPR